MLFGEFDDYWNQTETYEALKMYINMNFDGLKDDIIKMLAGEHVKINIGKFTNDMTTFADADDVLTLLIHLGYLAYDNEKETVYIPNREIGKEFYNAIEGAGWTEVVKAVKKSEELLNSIWNMEEEKVARGMEQAHFETSILQYHDENALSYTVSLALYAAREYYTMYREMPTGKGYADIVFVPRKKYADKPALVVELKWNLTANGAIEQIKEKEYPTGIKGYEKNLLIVGINYDKNTKIHSCRIERYRGEDSNINERSKQNLIYPSLR